MAPAGADLLVLTVKVAVLFPAATVTLAGTTTPEPDDSVTLLPPAGAIDESCTVPTLDAPGATDAGFSETP